MRAAAAAVTMCALIMYIRVYRSDDIRLAKLLFISLIVNCK
jgi:hypothetical protein